MKNLHNIQSVYTDRQLAHLWFITVNRAMRARIRKGVVERTHIDWGTDWRHDWWTTKSDDDYIMRRWNENDRPAYNPASLEIS